MLLEPLGRGLLLGFAIAAPVGPIGVLCIQRTLRHGRAVGLATGLGAATADAAYGLLGACGLAGLGQALAAGQRWLSIAGAAWLAWLGWRTLRRASGSSPAGEVAAAVAASAPTGAFASALGLTLTNPATILSFAAMFAGLGLPPGIAAAGWLVLGVFAGSALWWLLLSSAVARVGHALGQRALHAVDLGSGCVLLAFAAWALWRGTR